MVGIGIEGLKEMLELLYEEEGFDSPPEHANSTISKIENE